MGKSIKLLTNPLDKGEKWEKKSKRIIKICKSSDYQPYVYLRIFKKKKNNKYFIITEDFFLTPKTATKIANQLLETVKQIKLKK